MQFIPTNDVFHHLLHLLQLYKDKDLMLEIFEAQNIEISNAKIKAWATKTGGQKPGYREMPRDVLDAFIDELYIRKLVKIDNDEPK